MEKAERSPAAPGACPEQAMGAAAARLLALLALPLVAGAWLVAGPGGALGAGAGLILVLALFGLTGLVLSRLRVVAPSVVVGVSLAGVGLRLAGYAVALALLGSVDAVHRPSLAAATLVGFIATLVYEIRVVSRTPAFFWVQASSGTNPTRSR